MDRNGLDLCVSVYLLVFIWNLLVHLAENTLLVQPLTILGDYQIPNTIPLSFLGSLTQMKAVKDW